MATQTTHYGFNKPGANDLVNPLVDTIPNWDIADENLYKNFNLGVTLATETVSQGVHTITRVESDLPMFRFVATANFAEGDSFVLDGVSVNCYTPDGASLIDNAYISGAVVIGTYNEVNSSIILYLNTTSTKVDDSDKLDGHDASYFAKASDVTAIDNTIDNTIGDTDISAIGSDITTAIKNVDTKANNNANAIGDLSELETSEQNSLVGAVNSVKNELDTNTFVSDVDISTYTISNPYVTPNSGYMRVYGGSEGTAECVAYLKGADDSGNIATIAKVGELINLWCPKGVHLSCVIGSNTGAYVHFTPFN